MRRLALLLGVLLCFPLQEISSVRVEDETEINGDQKYLSQIPKSIEKRYCNKQSCDPYYQAVKNACLKKYCWEERPSSRCHQYEPTPCAWNCRKLNPKHSGEYTIVNTDGLIGKSDSIYSYSNGELKSYIPKNCHTTSDNEQVTGSARAYGYSNSGSYEITDGNSNLECPLVGQEKEHGASSELPGSWPSSLIFGKSTLNNGNRNNLGVNIGTEEGNTKNDCPFHRQTTKCGMHYGALPTKSETGQSNYFPNPLDSDFKGKTVSLSTLDTFDLQNNNGRNIDGSNIELFNNNLSGHNIGSYGSGSDILDGGSSSVGYPTTHSNGVIPGTEIHHGSSFEGVSTNNQIPILDKTVPSGLKFGYPTVPGHSSQVDSDFADGLKHPSFAGNVPTTNKDIPKEIKFGYPAINSYGAMQNPAPFSYNNGMSDIPEELEFSNPTINSHGALHNPAPFSHTQGMTDIPEEVKLGYPTFNSYGAIRNPAPFSYDEGMSDIAEEVKYGYPTINSHGTMHNPAPFSYNEGMSHIPEEVKYGYPTINGHGAMHNPGVYYNKGTGSTLPNFSHQSMGHNSTTHSHFPYNPNNGYHDPIQLCGYDYELYCKNFKPLLTPNVGTLLDDSSGREPQSELCNGFGLNVNELNAKNIDSTMDAGLRFGNPLVDPRYCQVLANNGYVTPNVPPPVTTSGLIPHGDRSFKGNIDGSVLTSLGKGLIDSGLQSNYHLVHGGNNEPTLGSLQTGTQSSTGLITNSDESLIQNTDGDELMTEGGITTPGTFYPRYNYDNNGQSTYSYFPIQTVPGFNNQIDGRLNENTDKEKSNLKGVGQTTNVLSPNIKVPGDSTQTMYSSSFPVYPNSGIPAVSSGSNVLSIDDSSFEIKSSLGPGTNSDSTLQGNSGSVGSTFPEFVNSPDGFDRSYNAPGSSSQLLYPSYSQKPQSKGQLMDGTSFIAQSYPKLTESRSGTLIENTADAFNGGEKIPKSFDGSNIQLQDGNGLSVYEPTTQPGDAFGLNSDGAWKGNADSTRFTFGVNQTPVGFNGKFQIPGNDRPLNYDTSTAGLSSSLMTPDENGLLMGSKLGSSIAGVEKLTSITESNGQAPFDTSFLQQTPGLTVGNGETLPGSSYQPPTLDVYSIYGPSFPIQSQPQSLLNNEIPLTRNINRSNMNFVGLGRTPARFDTSYNPLFGNRGQSIYDLSLPTKSGFSTSYNDGILKGNIGGAQMSFGQVGNIPDAFDSNNGEAPENISPSVYGPSIAVKSSTEQTTNSDQILSGNEGGTGLMFKGYGRTLGGLDGEHQVLGSNTQPQYSTLQEIPPSTLSVTNIDRGLTAYSDGANTYNEGMEVPERFYGRFDKIQGSGYDTLSLPKPSSVMTKGSGEIFGDRNLYNIPGSNIQPIHGSAGGYIPNIAGIRTPVEFETRYLELPGINGQSTHNSFIGTYGDGSIGGSILNVAGPDPGNIPVLVNNGQSNYGSKFVGNSSPGLTHTLCGNIDGSESSSDGVGKGLVGLDTSFDQTAKSNGEFTYVSPLESYSNFEISKNNEGTFTQNTDGTSMGNIHGSKSSVGNFGRIPVGFGASYYQFCKGNDQLAASNSLEGAVSSEITASGLDGSGMGPNGSPIIEHRTVPTQHMGGNLPSSDGILEYTKPGLTSFGDGQYLNNFGSNREFQPRLQTIPGSVISGFNQDSIDNSNLKLDVARTMHPNLASSFQGNTGTTGTGYEPEMNKLELIDENGQPTQVDLRGQLQEPWSTHAFGFPKTTYGRNHITPDTRSSSLLTDSSNDQSSLEIEADAENRLTGVQSEEVTSSTSETNDKSSSPESSSPWYGNKAEDTESSDQERDTVIKLLNGYEIKQSQLTDILESLKNPENCVLTVPHVFSGPLDKYAHVMINFPATVNVNEGFVHLPSDLLVPFDCYKYIASLYAPDCPIFHQSPGMVLANGQYIEPATVAAIVASAKTPKQRMIITKNGAVIPFDVYNSYIHKILTEDKKSLSILIPGLSKPVSYNVYKEVWDKYVNSITDNRFEGADKTIKLLGSNTEISLQTFLSVINYYKSISTAVVTLPSKKTMSLSSFIPLASTLGDDYSKHCTVNIPNTPHKVPFTVLREIFKIYLETKPYDLSKDIDVNIQFEKIGNPFDTADVEIVNGGDTFKGSAGQPLSMFRNPQPQHNPKWSLPGTKYRKGFVEQQYPCPQFISPPCICPQCLCPHCKPYYDSE